MPSLLPLYPNTIDSSKPTRKIKVEDSFLNPREVVWKGRKHEILDYDLFVAIIKSIIEDPEKPRTKADALDYFFDMDIECDKL